MIDWELTSKNCKGKLQICIPNRLKYLLDVSHLWFQLDCLLVATLCPFIVSNFPTNKTIFEDDEYLHIEMIMLSYRKEFSRIKVISLCKVPEIACSSKCNIKVIGG